MQLPSDAPLERTNSSIFQQLLQQYSVSDIDRQDHDSMAAIGMEPESQHPRMEEDVWFRLDEVPQEHLLREEERGQKQPEVVEFKRIRSLREEQQNKIALFMREDRLMKAAMNEHNVNCSPVGKGWQSLSPKKTKKIEKNRWLVRSSSYITDLND